VFDGFRKETFQMRAMLFCIINDFPAYGNLSGYSVKGHHACPIYEEDTSYIQLKHGRKTVYTRHRHFLKPHHPYRRLKKAFNGSQEHEIARIPLTGEQVIQRVEHLNTVLGKTQKKDKSKSCIWKKRSIFFDLPYWSDLDVRHCIDVMHVEKNVCHSVIGTLLSIQGKTKDGLNTRQDLADMAYDPSCIQGLMVKKYTCLQLVILCPERRRSVFASVCVGLKSHKDTLQILRALCS